MVTYFVVLAFQQSKRGALVADEPKEIHGGADRCISAAKRLAQSRAGVVAFSRTGDPKMGDWEDAVVLWQEGLIPEDVLAVA